MTIPLWAPFALLTAVCAIYPAPAWTRRVDWYALACWSACLVFCLTVWFGVFLLVRWAA